MSILFDINAEAGGSTPWEFTSIIDSPTSVTSLSTDQADSPTHSYKCVYVATKGCGGLKSFTAQSEMWVRFYIRFASFTIGAFTDDYIAGLFLTDQYTPYARVMMGNVSGSSGPPSQWGIYVAATPYRSAVNFSFDTWHYLEVHYKAGGIGTGQVTMTVDGSAACDTGTGIDLTGLSPDNFLMGSAYPYAAPTIYFDDIKAATTGPIGAYSAGGPNRVQQAQWWNQFSRPQGAKRIWKMPEGFWTPRRRMVMV